ncbi:hypothetical protein GCM10010123_42180 [Pilimelia anulata]|uniref:Polyhydroxyalkanoate synthesis regulator phasin n=2 Tax=Pilimelia anulata TaxID=53371 RepID=A0A8J3BAS2_9ACTN|nr:hypothetical protein GCM10010123_42180 [Pilimelia anulata]
MGRVTMQETWQAYFELLTGVTEATRKRARGVATKLVGSGVATAAQVQALTEDLMSNGAANRAALERTVRAEIDRTLDRVGLARADEVDRLAARVDALSAELAAVTGRAPERAGKPARKAAPAKKAAPDKARAGDGGEPAAKPAKKVAKKAVKKTPAPAGDAR